MTEAQMAKADGLCETADLDQIRFVEGHIEDPPLAAGSCDTVISHGRDQPVRRQGGGAGEAADFHPARAWL
jgi:hypothetical protein